VRTLGLYGKGSIPFHPYRLVMKISIIISSSSSDKCGILVYKIVRISAK